MAIAKQPSKLSLPQLNPGVASVLEYLIIKFPGIEPDVWHRRMMEGKVHWHDGTLISPDSPFQPQQRVYYYREVENEPLIPFEEEVIYQDEHILVAYKPHFLTVTPGGVYINECLQNRLRIKTGIDSLQAMHRLDRVTAGLVLFSINPGTRHLYHQLFASQQIHKSYRAVAKVNPNEDYRGQQWELKNRIVVSELRFRMKIIEGKPNSHTRISCLQQTTDTALFQLHPITGKTHQLRLHMQALGCPILNDRYYPTLQAESADDYHAPLQLLAKELNFIDPVTQQDRHFSCRNHLLLS